MRLFAHYVASMTDDDILTPAELATRPSRPVREIKASDRLSAEIETTVYVVVACRGGKRIDTVEAYSTHDLAQTRANQLNGAVVTRVLDRETLLEAEPEPPARWSYGQAKAHLAEAKDEALAAALAYQRSGEPDRVDGTIRALYALVQATRELETHSP